MLDEQIKGSTGAKLVFGGGVCFLTDIFYISGKKHPP
jgi:hypothetical protein